MIRNIMLKLIDMKKAIKFFITMYALTVETNQSIHNKNNN